MFGDPSGNKGESAESLKNKGNAAKREGNIAEAESFYRKAINADPDYMPAYYNLGNVLQLQGLYNEALGAYQAALNLAPDDYEIYVNTGVTLNAMNRFDEAIEAFSRAERLAPDALEPTVNKGVALDRSGRYEEAIDALNQAIKRDPACSIARYYRSMSYLRLERWKEGFLEHEARLELPDTVPEDLLAGKQKWDGAPLDGRTLLIYPEQGMGDMIQFLRYVPLCKAAGARVMVCCHPPLAPLLATASEIDVVAPDGVPLPEPFDAYISVMSLAHVLGRHQELPPLRLDVPVETMPVIAQAKDLKVGVCWRGNPKQSRDSERSIAGDEFWKHLAGMTGVSFFSLQIDDDNPNGLAIPLAPYIDDFYDTANLVQQLDLVVTVCTSVAHLCGTLGIPTWVLLSFSPDWRWGVAGKLTPWYPSVRLFRQPSPGNWGAPLIEIRKAIESKTGAEEQP
ncbi:MAG: tetratricopeptide repeat-containing glycosyltransferase family protein [Gallionellaceae bacterium]|nr:tetratricopeptide repeat-containing glycosyltransferase family protein [Gallionellaceae bacterium]